MSITRILTPENVKDCKPMAKGGKELISEIKIMCLNYGLAITNTVSAIGNMASDGKPWVVAITASGAVMSLLAAYLSRKKILTQIKNDYRAR